MDIEEIKRFWAREWSEMPTTVITTPRGSLDHEEAADPMDDIFKGIVIVAAGPTFWK